MITGLVLSGLATGLTSSFDHHQSEEKAPSLFPEGYLDHAGLTERLQGRAEEHSDLNRIQSLTKTPEGRDLWLVQLGVIAEERTQLVPAPLIVTNLEADHLVGSEVALRLVERLATESQSENIETFLSQNTLYTLYIVPRLNPDGAERIFKHGAPVIRTSLRPIDEDRDAIADEDGPEDINGDGQILSMRVQDLEATLIPNPDDPRIFQEAERSEGERPLFSEFAEGFDNDGDGKLNEDPISGLNLNLNRNWPHNWTEFDDQAGISPGANPRFEP